MASRAALAQSGADASLDSAEIDHAPASSVERIGVRSKVARQPVEVATLADENQRARLIADIARLIREPAVPENMRVAGLTLIGWLARRRPEEAPHAIGVPEALESERRLQAIRAK
jgi:hypothetical protein